MSVTLNASTSSGLVMTPDNSGALAIQSAGTTGATINAYGIGLGTAVPSSGVGITFPATQSASSDANTLDDYEEGTWTPGYTLDAGSISSYSSSGRYIKIGRQVTLTLYFYFGSTSSAAINAITGFPFASENVDPLAIGSVRENAVTGYMWMWRANQGTTQGVVRRYDNASGVSNGFAFVGTLTYFTA